MRSLTLARLIHIINCFNRWMGRRRYRNTHGWLDRFRRDGPPFDLAQRARRRAWLRLASSGATTLCVAPVQPCSPAPYPHSARAFFRPARPCCHHSRPRDRQQRPGFDLPVHREDQEFGLLADPFAAHQPDEIVDPADRSAADGEDVVALAQPAAGGRTAGSSWPVLAGPGGSTACSAAPPSNARA